MAAPIEYEIKSIPIGKIVPNSWNPQSMPEEEFARLCDEIASVGFTAPIQVVPLNDGTYRILGGEHRWRAAQANNYESIPCVLLSTEQWADIDLQKFVTVRMNAIQGKLNPEKFLVLYNEMTAKYGSDAIQGLMGFCLVAGTVVETAEGPKPIDKVRIGELVFNGLGSLEPVLNIVEEFYDGDIVEIHSTKICKPLRCTPGHHLFVAVRDWSKTRRIEFSGVSEIFAGDVSIGDGLLIPTLVGSETHLKVPDAVLDKQLNQPHGYQLVSTYLLTPDLGWLLGLYAADGSSDPDSSVVSICLGVHQTESISRLQRVYREVFGLEATPQPTNSPAAVDVRVYSRRLAESFSKWFGASTYTKHFPVSLMLSNQEILTSVFDGYVDGDGSNSATDEWRAQTVSEGLALQLVRIAATLGYRFSLSEIPAKVDKRGVNYSPSFNLWFKKNPSIYSSQFDGTPVGEIKEIETCKYRGMVYDLTLGGEHSYIAGGFRVGNTDTKAFQKALGTMKRGVMKSLPTAEMQKEFEEKSKEARTVDDLSSIIQSLFAKYGDSVEKSFMIFAHGGQEHIYIAMDPAMKKQMDKVLTYCRLTGEDINHVLAPVTEAYMKSVEAKMEKKAPTSDPKPKPGKDEGLPF